MSVVWPQKSEFGIKNWTQPTVLAEIGEYRSEQTTWRAAIVTLLSKFFGVSTEPTFVSPFMIRIRFAAAPY